MILKLFRINFLNFLQQTLIVTAFQTIAEKISKEQNTLIQHEISMDRVSLLHVILKQEKTDNARSLPHFKNHR